MQAHTSSSDPILVEVAAARQRAEVVLQGLIAAQSECEKQLTQENRRDAMKVVTGKSSLENAIAATKRMIESFDRQIQELSRGGGVVAGALIGAQVRIPTPQAT